MRDNVRSPQSVALQTSPECIYFLVRGERVAAYLPHASVPGFSTLMATEGRNLLQADETTGVGLWVAHGSVNGIPFGLAGGEATERAGRIASREFLARRGAHSVGFRHECAWIGPDSRTWLRDVRTVRIYPGPSGGCRLDMILTLFAPETDAVRLDATEAPFLAILAARPLFPVGGGQFRNDVGGYDVEAVNGQSAAWCGCIGVVQGETVGFALLDYPHNPFSPALWIAQEEGLFSPSPFLRHPMELAPSTSVTFRYRLQTHRGYVDQGWATERLAEFTHDPMHL